ncbi:unnamed protein product [Lampetra fluviatilis]
MPQRSVSPQIASGTTCAAPAFLRHSAPTKGGATPMICNAPLERFGSGRRGAEDSLRSTSHQPAKLAVPYGVFAAPWPGARFPGALPPSHPEPPFCPRCPRHVRVGTDSRVPYREFCRSFGYPVALARSAPWPGDDAALLGFYELRGTGGSLVQRGHATGCAARGYHPETLLFDAEGHLDSVLLTLGLGHGAVTRVALFSSHAPCGHEALGCVSRILGFLEAHPGVRLEVYFAQFESGFAEAGRGFHRPPYGQRDGTDEGGSLRDLVGLRPRVTVAPISGGMWGKILRDFVSNVPPLALMNPVNHLRAREDSENAARLAGTTGVWPPYVDLAPVPSRQYRDLVFGDFGHQFDDQRDHDELTNASPLLGLFPALDTSLVTVLDPALDSPALDSPALDSSALVSSALDSGLGTGLGPTLDPTFDPGPDVSLATGMDSGLETAGATSGPAHDAAGLAATTEAEGEDHSGDAATKRDHQGLHHHAGDTGQAESRHHRQERQGKEVDEEKMNMLVCSKILR